MLHCSEPTIRRLNICFFLKNSSVFFQWSCASFLQSSFVETFAAELDFFLFSDRSSNRFYCTDNSFRCSENTCLKSPGSRLSCLICSLQQVRGKKLLNELAEKLLLQSFFLTLFQVSLISRFIQSSRD